MTDLVHLFILSHIITGIYIDLEVYNMAYHDKGDFYLSRFFLFETLHHFFFEILYVGLSKFLSILLDSRKTDGALAREQSPNKFKRNRIINLPVQKVYMYDHCSSSPPPPAVAVRALCRFRLKNVLTSMSVTTPLRDDTCRPSLSSISVGRADIFTPSSSCSMALNCDASSFSTSYLTTCTALAHLPAARSTTGLINLQGPHHYYITYEYMRQNKDG